MNQYYTNILSNCKNGTLYVGYTNNLQRRIFEHKNKIFEGFTKDHHINKLVYFETFLSMEEAKLYEQRIKKWHRKWKIELIERDNPEWNDLSKNFDKILTPIEKFDLLFGK
jgi:putative endonuclease